MSGAQRVDGVARQEANEASESREQILDAAERLMTEVGYGKTSISAICRESGLPVGSVYHHFGSKARLLREIVVRVHNRFAANWQGLAEADTDLDRAFERFWTTNIDMIVADYRTFALDVELVQRSHESPEIRDLSAAVATQAHGLLESALVLFARAAGIVDPDQLAGRIAAAIFTYTRGSMLEAGQNAEQFRSEMVTFYPLVRQILQLPDSARATPAQ